MSNNLKETISNLQKDFIANPKNAVVQYESSSILKEGLQSVVTLREHKLDSKIYLPTLTKLM